MRQIQYRVISLDNTQGSEGEISLNQMDEVKFEVRNQVGWVTLNRPRALNALSFPMVRAIKAKLQNWGNDSEIKLIVLQGNGGKSLCAGGDVRSLYDEKINQGNAEELARQYLSCEYEMDLLIHQYTKPILVYMDGIVMGGGVGISIGCGIRIVTEKTKWAMPEMNIGFFPDVGASYFLNQMPGFIGRYLALTSETIKAEDVLYIGAADEYISSTTWNRLEEGIMQTDWSAGNAGDKILSLVKSHAETSPSGSDLQENQNKIDSHFGLDSIEEIFSSLEKAATLGDDWASHTLAILKGKSPTSLKVTFEQLEIGKNLTLEECFNMEVGLGVEFMRNHDFFEGVRAVLVYKDRNAKWRPSTLQEVNQEDVKKYFVSFDRKE